MQSLGRINHNSKIMNEKPGWIGSPEIKDIRTTKDESTTRLKKLQKTLPGLLGYGITHGSGEHISVLVEKITPEIKAMFRSGIRGQPVKIIEVGHVVALSDRMKRFRPLIGGISIGHYLITAGTLGAIVYDKDTNKPLILSNCHVFANSDTPYENLASVGDSILQPGKIDDQNSSVVATLHRWVPLKDGVTVDAAVAAPTVNVSNTILDIPNITGTARPQMDMIIDKSGRTTGLTKGRIISTDSSISVAYSSGSILLNNQFITTVMSDGGDSGSLGITSDGKAVGLLFAGSNKVTIFNDISNVLNALNIKLLPYNVDEYKEPLIDNELSSKDIAILIGAGILIAAGICALFK